MWIQPPSEANFSVKFRCSRNKFIYYQLKHLDIMKLEGYLNTNKNGCSGGQGHLAYSSLD